MMKKKIAGLCSVVIAAALIIAYAPLEEAFASHNAEPSMWVNGINAYQTHSYIYNVAGPMQYMDMSVALMIKDMEEKPNVKLTARDPTGLVTVCPIVAGTVGGGPANLLVSECFFSPPALGIWTFTITAGAIMNNPVGYAIAADTVTVMPDGMEVIEEEH